MCLEEKKKTRVCHPQLAELLLNLPRNPSAEELGTHFTTGILDETISSIENHSKILSKCAQNPGQKNIVILKPRPGQVKIRSVHSDQTSWSLWMFIPKHRWYQWCIEMNPPMRYPISPCLWSNPYIGLFKLAVTIFQKKCPLHSLLSMFLRIKLAHRILDYSFSEIWKF